MVHGTLFSAFVAALFPFPQVSYASQPAVAQVVPTVAQYKQIPYSPPQDSIIWVSKSGDTLKSIAKGYYGDESFWTTVWNDNSYISNPNVIPDNSTIYVRNTIPTSPEELKPELALLLENPRSLSDGDRYIYLMNHTSSYGTLTWSMPLLTYRYMSTPYSYGHPGIDLTSFYGTPIYAAADGTVIEAGWSTIGYGNTVVIAHDNGFVTRYAHMSSLKVQKGQYVTRGSELGGAGCTGHCTGVHLHFEVWEDDQSINPLQVIALWK